MTRFLFVAACAAIAAIFPAQSWAASPMAYDKICKSENGQYLSTVSGEAFVQTFFTAYPVPLSAPMMLRSGAVETPENCAPGRRFSSFDDGVKACGFAASVKLFLSMAPEAFAQACSAPGEAAQCGVLKNGRAELGALLGDDFAALPRAGEFSAQNADNAPALTGLAFFETAERPGRIWQVLSDPSRLSLACSAPKDAVGLAFMPDLVRVTRRPEEFHFRPSENRKVTSALSPAEFSLVFDRQNRVTVEKDDDGKALRQEYADSVNFTGAFGRTFRTDDHLTLTPFVSLDYGFNFNPAQEKDDLTVGTIIGMDSALFTGPIADYFGAPSITAAWITDIEQRESAIWKGALRGEILAVNKLSKMEQFKSVPFLRKLNLSAFLVGDYLHVVRAGDKVGLANTGEVFRIGYDLQADLSELVTQGDFKPSLKLGYQYRESLSTGGGAADLVTVDLGLFTLQELNATIGLSYQRGETIDSLTPIEGYKLVFRFRQ